MFSVVTSSAKPPSFMTSLTSKSVILSSSMTLLLVVIFSTEVSVTQAAPATEPRWLSPCSGSTRVVEHDDATRSTHPPSTVSEHSRNHLRSIIDSARILRSLVQILKTNYIDDGRFISREDANVVLANYPEPYLTNLRSPWSIAFETDMILMVAYKDLAQMSLYIERAKHGEETAQNQHRSFFSEYRKLEHHSSGGVYTLLCHLHRAMINRGLQLSRDAENELRGISLGTGGSRSVHTSSRHSDDYTILHVLEQLLNDLHTSLSRILLQQTGVHL